jgi:outer membrane protein assembly factor BamB
MARQGRTLRRREWLRLAGTVGAAGAAGCTEVLPSPDGGPGTDESSGDDTGGETGDDTGGGTVDDTGDGETSVGGSGDGWAQFRRDGRNSGVAPAGTGPGGPPSLEWQFETGALLDVEGATVVGRGVSSPVVAAGTVVVNVAVRYLADDETGMLGAVVGLDPASGAVEWTHEWSAATVDAVPDPVVVDGSVVALSLDIDEGRTHLAVLDPATGERTGDAAFEEFVSAMTAGRDRAYARTSSGVVALDPDGWREVWSTGTDRRGTVLDHPAVTGDRVLTSQGARVVALDAGTGDEQWRATFEVSGDLVRGGSPTPFADPVVVDGTAYVAGSLRTVYSRGEAGLVAFDPASGEERWRFTPEVEAPDDEDAVAASAAYGYPLVVDGSLYVTGFRGVAVTGDGAGGGLQDVERRLFELDPASGSVRDEHELRGVSVAPVAAGGRLYLPASPGVVTATTGGEVDVVAEASPLLARSPAVGSDRVVVAVREGVVALGG